MKRWCKRPPAPPVTGVARQTPPGARPDRERSRAARPSSRVGRDGDRPHAGRERRGRRRRRPEMDGRTPPPVRRRRGQDPAYRPARPPQAGDLRNQHPQVTGLCGVHGSGAARVSDLPAMRSLVPRSSSPTEAVLPGATAAGSMPGQWQRTAGLDSMDCATSAPVERHADHGQPGMVRVTSARPTGAGRSASGPPSRPRRAHRGSCWRDRPRRSPAARAERSRRRCARW